MPVEPRHPSCGQVKSSIAISACASLGVLRVRAAQTSFHSRQMSGSISILNGWPQPARGDDTRTSALMWRVCIDDVAYHNDELALPLTRPLIQA